MNEEVQEFKEKLLKDSKTKKKDDELQKFEEKKKLEFDKQVEKINKEIDSVKKKDVANGKMSFPPKVTGVKRDFVSQGMLFIQKLN